MPDEFEELDGAGLGVASVHAEAHAQGLVDLLADAHDRVERGHRVLEDHGDLGAPDRALLVLARAHDLEAVDARTSRSRVDVDAWLETHDGAREHGLARARLADDAEGLVARRGRTRHRPRRARSPPAVAKVVVRSLTTRSCLVAHSLTSVTSKCAADAVADEVEADQEEAQGEGREDRRARGSARAPVRASLIMLPHDGVGGFTDRPRNASAPSRVMTVATPIRKNEMRDRRDVGQQLLHRGFAGRWPPAPWPR